jgi:hypothetical protein
MTPSFKLRSGAVAANLRGAIGALPDEQRMLARAVVDGRSSREIADLLGLQNEQEADARIGALLPMLARVAFAQRCEVSGHLVGELVAVSADLEQALYRIVEAGSHFKDADVPTFAVLSHGGATLELAHERPPGEWLDLRQEGE